MTHVVNYLQMNAIKYFVNYITHLIISCNISIHVEWYNKNLLAYKSTN